MSVVNLKGNDFKLSGKDVYINRKGVPGMIFVHSLNCGHCVKFTPKYAELCKYLGDGFKCFAIEASDLNEGLSKGLGVEYFPTLKFVDQNGKVIGTFPSDQERSLPNILKYICNVYHHCVKNH